MRDVPNGERGGGATSGRTVSDDGLAFIKAHEGFRPRATPLPDGRWVIGYSSIEEAAEGREMTPEEGGERLKHDLEPIEEVLNALVFAPLTQRQFDALLSLGFSIGADALRRCGVADALNDGRPIDAAAVFDAWRQAQVGDAVKPIDALVRRRAAEKAMFLALDDGPVAASSALLRPLPNGAVAVIRAPFQLERIEPDRMEPGSIEHPAKPSPEVIERLAKILPERPPMEADAEIRVGGARVAELAGARVRARGAAVFPSAPYPIRRGMASPGSGAAAPRGGAGSGGRSGRGGGALAASRALLVDWTEQWPWFLVGTGLAAIAVGAANLSAGGSSSGSGPGGGLAWLLATIFGALALAAGGYHAARRFGGFDE